MDDNFLNKGSAMQSILMILDQVVNSDRPVTTIKINKI